ncbi:heavy metal translocating P-type ATPase [Brunnivagina elsteri]|uniref:Heavy metal translocating P-type ATPase n=1 Tax=Brunnivagina elsteri CCALA 953 TaxID=987040 RepID=A0A2A2TFQ3_9CYAN|nr:heavy metal translocating P-type ATPase [Calothrix elsteri]PAX52506.1 heavy metal translocating P-type ATPase [Calothrix elsteri CCALA 953]
MQTVPSTEQKPDNNLENPSAKKTAVAKITLDVGGMKCAGCVRSVERQLSQYPGIVNVCVNLATEVAVVESEIGVVDAEALAKHLTVGGFPTQPRVPHGKAKDVEEKRDKHSLAYRKEMDSALSQLIVAGLLLLLSTLGHFGNILDRLVPGLNNIWFHCGLATIALLIPGRSIIVDGWLGLRRNAPNMNTLIGLGTVTAYTASIVALLFPKMGWECFFDEPVMMLGFILLGKTLEQQARTRAASAFKSLLALQPQVARLIGKSKSEIAPSDSSLPNPFSNGVVEIPAEQVRIGEWLQVLPGEKIPVDGEVVYGQTTVDESMLTGEVIPIIKQPGDGVTAGTINQSGAIAIAATRIGSDTTLAQIIALVEAAQTRKAPVQKLADTVAGYFTYFVLSASLLTFLFWYFCGTHIWSDVVLNVSLTATSPMGHLHEYSQSQIPTLQSPFLLSLKLAIAVMVVACPCALGLATPTAILVGTAMSAERGLLIKGGDVLETIHKLDTIVFDKTGTLTTGKPTVTDCIVLTEDMELEEGGEKNSLLAAQFTSQSLLEIAASVEKGTCHPLATAIQNAAQTQHLFTEELTEELTEKLTQELTIPEAVNFHTEPGLGVSALVDGKSVLLGNSDWLSWHGVVMGDTGITKAQELANEGKTIVYIAVSGRLVGIIAVSDSLRPEAKTTIEKLRQMGLRVMILSGDRIEAATTIAKQLDIDSHNVIAGVPPTKKAATIQMLQDDKGKNLKSIVAMVGDGINDAPALSQADVGIAMHSGTDVAMETAGIILMRDRLTDVVESIRLSRATFNKIRQNLFWAFAYNTIGIPLAAGILLPNFGFVLNPASAAALMAFSSVSVVTNSLLLRRVVSPN